MKKDIKYMYFIRVVLVLFFGLFLHFNSNVVAQNATPHGTQISDGTSPNVLSSLPFSLLELNSNERGFLMPRMTTAERSAIPKNQLIAGLIIYNTSMGCVEFYNATRQVWMNMCGDVEPAIFTIPNDKCSQIGKNIAGDYIQGVLLDSRKNLISVEVNVSSPGTFDIEAVAYDNTGNTNGYTFTTKGVFPTSGNFLLVLKGSGTPKKGYANVNTKDEIRFTLNKKLSTCIAYNHVKPDFEPLVAAFDCTIPVGVEGTYKEKEPLTSANRLIASIKVTKPGRGKIYGEIPISGKQTELIKYESETVDFRVTDVNQVQTVILSPVFGTGKPTMGGKLTGKLKLISKGRNEYDPFAPEEILTVQGCDFEIKVKEDGPKYDIRSVELISPFMTKAGVKNKFGGDVTVGLPYITPRTNMNGNNVFKARLHVIPKAPGQYVISTKEVNGIKFEGTGDITEKDVDAGYMSIDLKASGTSQGDIPRALGMFNFVGNNLDPELSNTALLYVDFVYRPMVMYSVGGASDQSWHPGGNNLNSTWSAGPRIIRQYKHFSWDGIVRIASLNIIDISEFTEQKSGVNTASDMSAVSNSGTFKSNLDKSDMVFIGGYGGSNFTKRPQQLKDLAAFVKANGALVYGEGDASNMNSFFTEMNMSASATNNTTRNTYPIEINPSKANRIIIGTSGKYFSSGDAINGLGGLSLAGHGTATQINFTVSSSEVTPIAGTNGSFAFVHNTYGFVGVGSSTFMGGFYNDGGGNYYYPVTGTTDGTPLKRNFDGKGAYVYNSWFLLNLVHWAIDYSQEKQIYRNIP